MQALNAHSPKHMNSFTKKVLAAVRKIPKGHVLTYKQVAAKAGKPKASRAVGTIMNHYNVNVTGIPCHRVVRSDGMIGGYIAGTKKKIALLQKEGVAIKNG